MSAPVADAVDAIRRGEIIIVVDDPDREDEGDFVMAAQRATPAAVNQMVTHGRGLLCLPMEGARLDMLGVPDMVPGATAETAFTVSVDLDEPGRTGISAADRARCIRHAVDPAARASDFRRPCSRCGPARAGCWSAAGTPRRPSTSPDWPGSPRPG
jgi:3,4-dihydroxy-2-butanone 4-phosphate synthase